MNIYDAYNITRPLRSETMETEPGELLDQIHQEQARDYHRAECELHSLLVKIDANTHTRSDVYRLKGLLKFLGVNVD